jgi:hypothetical protein
MLKEMFEAVEAGQKQRDDRDFPWTPMTRRAFLTPSIYSPSAEDRVFKQPEGVRRFSRPLPARGFNQFVANGANIPNKERVHTPHIYDRKNFTAPSVLPRAAGLMGADYDATPQDIADGGLVSLLTKPIDINVPDPRDLEWVAERARLDAEGKPHVLPFGRKQLTFKKNVTLVDEFAQGISHAHSLKERVKIIGGAVTAGLGKTVGGLKQVGKEVAKVLIQNSLTNTLTAVELAETYKTIKNLNIKKDWRVSFGHRFWSASQFKSQKANILLYLLSRRTPEELKKHPNEPILKYKYDTVTDVLTRDKFTQISFLESKMADIDSRSPSMLATKAGAPRKVPKRKLFYVDLVKGGVVPLQYALMEVRSGSDSRKLNGLEVPHVLLDEKANDVLPVGIYNEIWANKNLSGDDKQKLGVNINPNAGITHKLIEVPQFNVPKKPSPAASPAVKAVKKAASPAAIPVASPAAIPVASPAKASKKAAKAKKKAAGVP